MWRLSAPFHSELLCEGYEVPVWSLYVLHCAATGGPRHAGPGAKMATSAWHHLFGEWSANVLVFKFVKFKVRKKKKLDFPGNHQHNDVVPWHCIHCILPFLSGMGNRLAIDYQVLDFGTACT